MAAATAAVAADNGGARRAPRHLDILTAAHGTVPLEVEIADNARSRARGLMFRKSLAPGHGMLFVYALPVQVSFWMKNTYLPLDILFIDADGKVTRIAARAPPLSTEAIPSGQPVLGVLEINGGRAEALGIEPGDRVVFPPLWPKRDGGGGAPAAPAQQDGFPASRSRI